MFVGHLPAGYLTAAALCSRDAPGVVRGRLWWAAALVGSVLPDLDMFYFYTLGQRQTLHHVYWTHLPFVWACVAVVLLWHPVSRVFVVSVFGHLLFDTIAGGVLWLWPFDSRSVVLVEVPAVYGWWVWNFIFHWSFAFEIAVTLAAVIVWLIRRRRLRVLRFE
ncbi:MAG: hypothetical protein A2341_08180 [Deltaproteobacteria bacterium RIFOXYB12_FULL_58_9]|nr:MAG: hypothetical protein A2341_08180 [Deltaproteobacteria bacterium RIFOXYB12_FULL_58_9]